MIHPGIMAAELSARAPELDPEQRDLVRQGRCPFCRRLVREWVPPHPAHVFYREARTALLMAGIDEQTGHFTRCPHKDWRGWLPRV